MASRSPDLFEHFGTHLLALCLLVDLPEGRIGYQVVSGSLVELRQRWFFLTAGHNLAIVKHLLAEGRVHEARLADMFTPSALASLGTIPFPLVESGFLHMDEDDLGVDFGVIGIDEHRARLLCAGGADPLQEEMEVNAFRCDGYYAVGFPAGRTSGTLDEAGRLDIKPLLLRIRSLSDEEVPTNLRRPAPRFYGWLPPGRKPDLRGMSGGPIFGVSSATGEYRLVAVETSVRLPDIIIGCPAAVALGAVRRRLDDL